MTAKAASWALLGLIVFWTWGPVGYRPGIGHPQWERFAAYFVLAGGLTCGYREQKWRVLAGVILAAAVLEIGQTFIPGRDGRVGDLMAKALGATAGFAVATAAMRWLEPDAEKARV